MKRPLTPWIWVLATLLAQTGWGVYPVLARYLQTVSQLPSMSLIALGNLLALSIILVLFFRRLELRAFRTPLLLLFSLIVVGRGMTNFLAARYTLSIFVQLVNQLTPFIVALMSTLFWHEKLPRYTNLALTLCLTGAILMMSGTLVSTNIVAGNGRNDLIGIGLAMISSLLLAIYMIAVRRSARYQIPGETLLITQLFSLSLSGFLLSFLSGEDWSLWTTISKTDWLIFGMLVVGAFASANALQIGAIRHLGAPMVSSTIAWRLVSALIFASLLLNERLTSIWQLLGAMIVLVTITLYLWRQATPARTLIN